MDTLLTLIHDRKKLIIAILVIVCLLLIVIWNLISGPDDGVIDVSQTPEIEDSEIPSPPMFSFPTHPPIPTEVQSELTYPVLFEGVTVEFKPKSGTFLVYYEGDIDQAEASAIRYLQSLGLSPADYRIEFRPLDATPIPPGI